MRWVRAERPTFLKERHVASGEQVEEAQEELVQLRADLQTQKQAYNDAVGGRALPACGVITRLQYIGMRTRAPYPCPSGWRWRWRWLD